MDSAEPADLDIGTLAWLAGSAANDHLLAQVHGRGHPGLRVAHGYVFQHLIEGAPTIGELAGRLGVTQQAASKVVGELESLGYVIREADPGDQRVRRIALTERGVEAVAAAREARADLEERLTGAVGESDAAAARRALAGILDLTRTADAVRRRNARPPSE